MPGVVVLLGSKDLVAVSPALETGPTVRTRFVEVGYDGTQELDTAVAVQVAAAAAALYWAGPMLNSWVLMAESWADISTVPAETETESEALALDPVVEPEAEGAVPNHSVKGVFGPAETEMAEVKGTRQHSFQPPRDASLEEVEGADSALD